MDRMKLRDSLRNNVVMTFARSSGAGGQNVNKVNTKVHAAVYVAAIGGLTDTERALVRARLANAVNADGQLCLDVDDERSQAQNRDIALARLEEKIVQAAHVAKKRKKTKPTRASKERRIKLKKIRSAVKSLRKPVDG